MKHFIISCLFVFAFFPGCTSSRHEAMEATVSIYFVNTSLEAVDMKSQASTPAPFVLYPVKRTIRSAVRERAALEELVKGPTTEERQLGYESMLEGLSVSEFEIADQVAVIGLAGKLQLAGLLTGPRLRGQLEKTLAQFGTIDSVSLKINGREDFDSLK